MFGSNNTSGNNPWDTTLTRLMKNYRKKQNLSQEELAEMIDVGTITICRLENGINAPSDRTLFRLLKIMGEREEMFFSIKEEYDKGFH